MRYPWYIAPEDEFLMTALAPVSAGRMACRSGPPQGPADHQRQAESPAVTGTELRQAENDLGAGERTDDDGSLKGRRFMKCDQCDAPDEMSLRSLADHALIDVEYALKKLSGCTGNKVDDLKHIDRVRGALDGLRRAKEALEQVK